MLSFHTKNQALPSWSCVSRHQVRVSPQGSLSQVAFSLKIQETLRESICKFITWRTTYRCGENYFSFCQYWSAQTQLEVSDEVTIKTDFQAQNCPYKTKQALPILQEKRPFIKTGAAPPTLLLPIMFCAPSPSIMSFCTNSSSTGALRDVGVSNPEPTFQNMLYFEKPIFVSQRNKRVCIIKPLSPQTQSLPYS